MKKILLALLGPVFFISVSRSQTTLAAGDLLFTGMYTNAAAATFNPDTFSFVTLRRITAGTTIYFSDRGWNGSSWQGSGGTEGTVSWVTGNTIVPGSEVTIAGLGATAAKINGIANGTVTQVAGGNATYGLSVGNGGDQLYAFQGGAGDPSNAAALKIGGIHFSNCSGTSDATWDPTPCAAGPSASAMPPGLTGGFSAFWAGAFQTQGKFNCAGAPYASPAALRSAIMNRANWTFSNDQFSYILGPPANCGFSTLPLTLLSFSAIEAPTGWSLQWTTADEVNTLKFDIERSADGAQFIAIGSVAATPTNGSVHNYNFPVSAPPFASNEYYRLKMIDRDLSYSYSRTISVDNRSSGSNAFRVYPNPVTGSQIYISTEEIRATALVIDLIDGNGKIISTRKAKANEVLNQALAIPVDRLSPGNYLLRINEDEGKKVSYLKLLRQ